MKRFKLSYCLAFLVCSVLLSAGSCFAEGDETALLLTEIGIPEGAPFYVTKAYDCPVEDITDNMLDHTQSGWSSFDTETDPDGVEYYLSMDDRMCIYDDDEMAILGIFKSKNLAICEKYGNTAIPTEIAFDVFGKELSYYDYDRESFYMEKFGNGLIYGNQYGFTYFDFENHFRRKWSMTTAPVGLFGHDNADCIVYADVDMLYIFDFSQSKITRMQLPDGIVSIFYIDPDTGCIIVRGCFDEVILVDPTLNVYYDTSIPADRTTLYVDMDCYVTYAEYALKKTTANGDSVLIKKADDSNLRGVLGHLAVYQFGDSLAYRDQDSYGAYTFVSQVSLTEPQIIGGMYSLKRNNYMKYQPGLYSTSISASDLIWVLEGKYARYYNERTVQEEEGVKTSVMKSMADTYMQHGVIWTPVNTTYGFLGSSQSDHYWVYTEDGTKRVEISLSADSAFNNTVDVDSEDTSIAYNDADPENGSYDPYPGYTTVRANEDTNIRTGPGLGHSIAGTLFTGGSVRYLDQYSVDERGVTWYKIEYQGMERWVSSRYTVLQ